MNLKKNRHAIKQSILIVCLVVMAFQFNSSFKQTLEIIEDNEPYKTVSFYEEPGFLIEPIEEPKSSFVRTDTLTIYTYKLIQTILLLFGMFMCLIFLAVNNKDFSLIELVEEINK